MISRFTGIRPSLCLFVFIFCLAGCAGDHSTSADQQVVRKKMPENPETTMKMAAAVEILPVGGSRPAEESTASEEGPPVEKRLSTEEGVSPAERRKTDLLIATGPKRVEYVYDRDKLQDPFKPTINTVIDDDEPGGGGDEPCPGIEIGTTPLEHVHLNHLKLTGIVRFANQGKAVLEDPQGKPYIVSKGTRVGMNAGMVEEIQEDYIIIKEKRIDQNCNITYHDEVVKLNRPDNMS